jgi:hypothetical protein
MKCYKATSYLQGVSGKTVSVLERRAYRCNGSTLTYGVGTQTELDQANQRINAFKEELLRQGFRQVSVSFSDSKEEFILEGNTAG